MPSARTPLLLLACVACASGSFVTSLLPRAHKQRLASSAITMAQAKGVVITGGAGGVGWAYADEFMRQGHWVVICDVKDPAPAVAARKAKHQDGPSRIYGIECDVSDSASVQRLTDFASESACPSDLTESPNTCRLLRWIYYTPSSSHLHLEWSKLEDFYPGPYLVQPIQGNLESIC